MKKIIGLVAILSACGSSVKVVPTVGVSNQKDAARLAATTTTKLQSLQGAARDYSVSASHNCATSGTVKVTITANGSAGGQGTTAGDIKFEAASCTKVNDYFFDGTIDMIYAVDTSGGTGAFGYSVTLNGTVAVIAYKADGSVDQSANITYNALKWAISTKTDAQGHTCYTARNNRIFTGVCRRTG